MIRLESVEVAEYSHLNFTKDNLLLLVSTRPSFTNAVTRLNSESKAEEDKKKKKKRCNTNGNRNKETSQLSDRYLVKHNTWFLVK